MQKTANFQLNQWEPTDPIRRADFNSDNAAIDAALKAVQNTAAGKADAADVNALSQSVSALTTALGSGGSNCRVAWGSYTGTGTYGSENPTGISVDFYPLLLVMLGKNLKQPGIYVRDCPNATCTWSSSNMSTVTWSDNGLSWYSDEGANYQNNSKSYVYSYVVLGYSI